MSSLQAFIDDLRDGVFIIGHASALFRIDGKLILCDPVWNHDPYEPYWHFAPEQINCDQILDKIDACFVSHIHSDHVCLEILEKLKCPIFIKDGRPQLKERLSQCDEVIELESYEWTTWGTVGEWAENNVEFLFVPHAFNSIDSSVFIRSKKTGYTVYHGNDNFISRSILEKLKSLVPHVDVALIPYAFIHWYPHLLKNISEEARLAEIARLNKQSVDGFCMFGDWLKPQVKIPTGSALFYAGMHNKLNSSLTSPNELIKYGALPLIAGDYIFDDGEYSQRYSPQEYEEIIGKAEEAHPIPVRGAIVYPGMSHVNAIAKKVSKATWRIPNFEIIVNNFVIDCETLSVGIRPFGLKPHMHFEFEPYEFRQWLEGEITLEQAIGTRRFVVSRVPNVYDPKVFDFMNLFL